MKKLIFIALAAIFFYGTAHAQSTSNLFQMKEISVKDYTTFKVSDKVALYAVTFPSDTA